MDGVDSKQAPSFGHRPVIGPITVRDTPRCSDALIERFQSAYIPDVVDAVGELYCMSADIRPLINPPQRLVGSALTVKAIPGDNMAIHGALAMVKPGDVLVVDWRGYVGGCGTGARSTYVPVQRGLRGVVIDGAWRDVAQSRAIGIPIYGRAISPYSPSKHRPGEINVPVACGGVIVHPGDILLADEEGVVVVPRRSAQDVADSLPPLDDPDSWTVEALVPRADVRKAHFDRAFADAGGSEVIWTGP